MKSNRRFPAEWETQRMVQLTWPDAQTDWGNLLDRVLPTYSTLCHEISKRQNLLIVARNRNEVTPWIESCNHNRIQIVEMPINDTWARDHGYIATEEDGHSVLLDFKFNGWGLKFASNHDNLINSQLWDIGLFGPGTKTENHLNVVFEGGSIESDGKGTLLTTSECLLSPNRNGGWSKLEIEAYLLMVLGASKMLWLEHGFLEGDDTDSHIDTLARLCPDNKIMYVQCLNETDPHFTELQLMETQLKGFVNTQGEAFELVPLPMCSPVFDGEERLPATYANFLFVNGAVLVPTYDLPEDAQALTIFQKHFPELEVVGINCRPLIEQHGSLHCVTMQFPASVTINR